MRSSARKGIIRRPVEHILISVLVLLTLFGFWIYWYTASQNQNDLSLLESTDQYVGTLDEINKITEDSMVKEQEIINEVESLYTNSADASADNVAGVYDESDY